MKQSQNRATFIAAQKAHNRQNEPNPLFQPTRFRATSRVALGLFIVLVIVAPSARLARLNSLPLAGMLVQ